MQASEVQIWLARPPAFEPAQTDAMLRLLNDEERARGAQLRSHEDRRAHAVAHGVCRTMLAAILGVRAQDLRFTRDAHGKPSLQDAGSGLYFSVSHTRGLVACAASYGGALGIDVEAIDPDTADFDLLQLFTRAAQGEAAPATPSSFYAHWTALEAYWKARGTGLSSANPRLRFTRAEGWLQARLEGDESNASRLFITPVEGVTGFAVSLACRWLPTLQVKHLQPGSPELAQKCDNTPHPICVTAPALPRFSEVA